MWTIKRNGFKYQHVMACLGVALKDLVFWGRARPGQELFTAFVKDHRVANAMQNEEGVADILQVLLRDLKKDSERRERRNR